MPKLSEDSPKQFIRRAMWVELVSRFPTWVETVWGKLDFQWSETGMMVFGCAGSGLATRLNQLLAS